MDLSKFLSTVYHLETFWAQSLHVLTYIFFAASRWTRLAVQKCTVRSIPCAAHPVVEAEFPVLDSNENVTSLHDYTAPLNVTFNNFFMVLYHFYHADLLEKVMYKWSK